MTNKEECIEMSTAGWMFSFSYVSVSSSLEKQLGDSRIEVLDSDP